MQVTLTSITEQAAGKALSRITRGENAGPHCAARLGQPSRETYPGRQVDPRIRVPYQGVDHAQLILLQPLNDDVRCADGSRIIGHSASFATLEPICLDVDQRVGRRITSTLPGSQ